METNSGFWGEDHQVSGAARSVKALSSHRNAIKERLRQKHMQRLDSARSSRLSAARSSVGASCSEGGRVSCAMNDCTPDRSCDAMHAVPRADVDRELVGRPSTGEECWRDLGLESFCDTADVDVVQYLCDLEEEIKRETMLAQYEEYVEPSEQWDEYYRSLTQ